MKTIRQMSMTVGFCLTSYVAFSQPPTGTPPANNTNARAAAAWYRGGNNLTNPNNIFGTMWNSPIYTYTAGINRMITNGNRTPTINGFNVNTSGYIGIGPNSSGVTGGNVPLWTNIGPYSLLHLNGNDGGGQQFGYRPWMKTGITFTEEFDLSYVGNRVIGALHDVNEFTLAWSNDATSPIYGPDDMVFRFINGAGTTVNNNFSTPSDLDGLHVARFTGTGLMGLGSTFGLTQDNPNYIRPQSLLHMSLDDYNEVWMQITNRLGTNQTANDGLRFGINTGGNPLGFLRWQELSPFVVQTDWDATAGGINNGERMRISSIGSNGVPKPANFIDDNVTRVAISHRGNTPITAPRSLLHLGYNTGNGAIGNFIADGWRDWMDIGTFTNNGTDNIYVGLKNEGTDRFDAVINWGDNQVAGNTPNGPDNLRFIFTSTTTALPPGGGDPVSQSNNGLETARFVPTKASTLPNSNFGMLGIGDWTTAFNIIPLNVIDAKLDIDGDLRIRTVTEDTTLFKVLVIDSADHNRVHWRSISSIGGGGTGGAVTAQNGLNTSVSGTGAVELGGNLLHNTQVNAPNGINLELKNTGASNLSIGSNPDVYTTTTPLTNLALGRNNLLSDASNSYAFGKENEIYGYAAYNSSNNNYAFGNKNKINKGVLNMAFGHLNIVDNGSNYTNGPQNSYAFGNENIVRRLRCLAIGNAVANPGQGSGYLVSIGNSFNNAGRDMVLNSLDNGLSSINTVHTESAIQNVNGIPAINITGNNNVGVRKYVPSCALDVVGSICATGSITGMSDSTMKTNINPLTNTMDLINQLRPISYEWINKTDTFMYGTQYGFTAQQVETVIPDLVHLGLDGKKVLNYTGLFAFLTQGIKEQQKTIDSMETSIQQQDSINNDLETRLAYLESCIRNANICEEGNRTLNNELNNATNQKSIELINSNSIILDQNMPNPFAENTVINYNIPTDVMEAKLLFYDLNGRIIKELIIEERGESKLTVYGTNLKTGVYTYSLIADGELIATKKMVKK